MADVAITDQTFKHTVLEGKLPVVVDFWAPWCMPCRMVSPVIEQLAEEYKDKVVVGKMNVDENSDTASKFGIMSIPTVMVFKDGKPVKSLIGAQRKDKYKKMIDEAVAA
jgi:thioredoxin 1